MSPPPIAERDDFRMRLFQHVWRDELDDIFVDVAPYYDRANQVASLGLWNWFSRRFMAMIDLRPNLRVLDVCAGTNAAGIAMLKREPTLRVSAIDRSASMQRVGQERARALGFEIDSTIGDAHVLPYPDNHFDVITLQWASRHLRVQALFREILRVLKPGGHFHHCDMLRPGNPVVKQAYYTYLRTSLPVTGLLYRSGKPAMNARKYFIDVLDAFYTTDELSDVLGRLGYCQVEGQSLLGGMVGLHRASKPEQGRPCPGIRKHRSGHGAR
jgi:demethylmenaquinone methyltransferase/2-methoxy-6-polyprenyl-1,4-benzoquinol methylase